MRIALALSCLAFWMAAGAFSPARAAVTAVTAVEESRSLLQDVWERAGVRLLREDGSETTFVELSASGASAFSLASRAGRADFRVSPSGVLKLVDSAGAETEILSVAAGAETGSFELSAGGSPGGDPGFKIGFSLSVPLLEPKGKKRDGRTFWQNLGSWATNQALEKGTGLVGYLTYWLFVQNGELGDWGKPLHHFFQKGAMAASLYLSWKWSDRWNEPIGLGLQFLGGANDVNYYGYSETLGGWIEGPEGPGTFNIAVDRNKLVWTRYGNLYGFVKWMLSGFDTKGYSLSRGEFFGTYAAMSAIGAGMIFLVPDLKK